MESLKSGTFICSIINFTVLMVILVYLLYRPIQEILEQRRQRISQDLEAAQKDKEMSERLHKEAQIALEEAHVEAYEIVEKSRTEAEQLREELTKQTRKELDQLRKRAQTEIERAEVNARDQMREEAVTLALLAVQKLVSKKMSAEFNTSLIDGVLEEIERGGTGMSSSAAHNFAKAIVELAREKNILEQVQNHAEYLMEGLNLDEVKFFLGNPRISSLIKKEFIHKLLLKDAPQVFINLLDLALDRQYGHLLGSIMEKVIDFSIKAQGYEIVTVISAMLLDEKEQSVIHKRLEKLWLTPIFLKQRLNPGLLGGAVIMRGDSLYDGSFAGQLRSLRKSLLTEID